MKDIRTRPIRQPWLGGIGLACLAFTGTGAAAEWPTETRSVTVRFYDLNINHPEGAQVLYQRIQSAARSVCGPIDTRLVAVRNAARKCYEEAITGAVSRVDNDTLTALHAARWKGLSLG